MEQNILLLPIIGAFIGYFTNFVAIKMLFLPKKPYFIFGIRIPFTPGLIPKKRKDLIDKISNVVATKVVNKKDIIKYIYRKKNRAFLYQFSAKLTDALLSGKISTLNINFESVEKGLELFLEKNLGNIIRKHLKNFDIDIEYFIYNAFLAIDKNKTIESYLTNKQLESIKEFSIFITDKALAKLSYAMESEEINQLIKSKIKNAIERYSDNSNILMASLIGMIAPLIEDSQTIPKIITKEIQSLLTDKIVKDKVSSSVYQSIKQEILEKDIKYVSKKLNMGSFEDWQKSVATKAREMFDKLSIKDKIIESSIDNIDTKQLAKQMVGFIKEMANSYTFRDVLNLTMPNIIEKLPSMAVNNLLFVLKKESDMIFNFDISKIAKEKLDKLDISEIEDVVLNISKDQFKYINIFGGVLGFLIGSIEVLIRF